MPAPAGTVDPTERGAHTLAILWYVASLLLVMPAVLFAVAVAGLERLIAERTLGRILLFLLDAFVRLMEGGWLLLLAAALALVGLASLAFVPAWRWAGFAAITALGLGASTYLLVRLGLPPPDQAWLQVLAVAGTAIAAWQAVVDPLGPLSRS